MAECHGSTETLALVASEVVHTVLNAVMCFMPFTTGCWLTSPHSPHPIFQGVARDLLNTLYSSALWNALLEVLHLIKCMNMFIAHLKKNYAWGQILLYLKVFKIVCKVLIIVFVVQELKVFVSVYS